MVKIKQEIVNDRECRLHAVYDDGTEEYGVCFIADDVPDDGQLAKYMHIETKAMRAELRKPSRERKKTLGRRVSMGGTHHIVTAVNRIEDRICLDGGEWVSPDAVELA